MKTKSLKTLGATVVAIVFLIFAYGSGEDKKNKATCSTSDSGYKSGYESGKKSVWSSPDTYIRESNNGYGMLGEVPPCWHEGFREGYKNR